MTTKARLRLACAIVAGLIGLATPASAGTVALTFDDLPVFGAFYTPAEGEDVTSRLLDGLKRHHLKAIGFVNEIQLANNYRPSRIAILKAWLPSALPSISIDKASALLQQTDRLIKTVPEVATVFGKAGRAETATDPAPLEMFETTIQFKPRDQWRPGMTPAKLVDELDRTVRMPGLTNVWVPPIRNRIDMLATGIKSPIGVKVSGSDLAEIDRIAGDVERVAKSVPGVSSALAERLTGGRYVDVDIDRAVAARFGLNIADVQQIVSGAIGGETIGQTVEGVARYPISVRYPRELRDSLEGLPRAPPACRICRACPPTPWVQKPARASASSPLSTRRRRRSRSSMVQFPASVGRR